MRAHPLLISLLFAALSANAQPAPSLVLEASVALPGVQGRIDHLAVDLQQRHLFVAELGNNSVDVIDMSSHSVTKRITGLKEPQGIAYSARAKTFYVAAGGDGHLHAYSGLTLRPNASIEVGPDADNVRIDDQAGRVYVGFDGGIAVLDAVDLKLLGRIALRAHPESFQLELDGQRIFVNVPEAHEIALLDRRLLKQVESWSTGDLSANFAMTLDMERHRVIAAFRKPAALGIFDVSNGKMLQRLDVCSDADDVYIDGSRRRLYASCGEGFVDLIEIGTNAYVRRDRVSTSKGARTSLFVPEWNQLLVAAPSTGSRAAQILVFAIGK
jgi:YVTN family beta-propeller protein